MGILTGLLMWLGMMADPRTATILGAIYAGHPEFAAELVSICEREGPGNDCRRTVGIHSNNYIGDVRKAYNKAISWKYMYLHPECPEHVVDRSDPAQVMRFGVRGMHGLMAAYSVRYLGPCVAPEALDIPFLSAVAATRRAEAMCARSGKCSKSERLTLWIGVKLEDKRLSDRGTRSAQVDLSPTSRSTTTSAPKK